MKQEIDNRITIKMFYGCPLLPDLRLQLEKSQQWKLAKIGSERAPLEVIRHQEKDYCGSFLHSDEMTISNLEAEAKRIHNKIKEFCSNYDTETLNFTIFPIVFIQ